MPQTTLRHIAGATKSYKGGTQIVDPAGAFESVCALLDLIRLAKDKGATPYEIERAFAGEVLGDSFEALAPDA